MEKPARVKRSAAPRQPQRRATPPDRVWLRGCLIVVMGNRTADGPSHDRVFLFSSFGSAFRRRWRLGDVWPQTFGVGFLLIGALLLLFRHRNLAEALLEKRDLNRAAGHARQAIRLNPKDAAAHSMLGAALAAQQDFDAALIELGTSLSLDPSDEDARQNLAAVRGLLRAKDTRRQVAAFLKTVT